MKLDEFESRFLRAAKDRFRHEPVRIGKVLLVTDLGAEDAAALLARARRLLRVLDSDEPAWEVLGPGEFDSHKALMARIEALQPDLIVTRRGLREAAGDLVYSLGSYLDVLAQVCPMPVLVLPSDEHLPAAQVEEGTPQVMVVTDHLTGEDRLVNWGLRFVLGQGDLYLTHVEDDHVFERYAQVIRRVPSIDTESALRDIQAQLLKEPRDYIDSCREALEAQGLGVKVHPVVELGHRVQTYRRLAEEHQVDLLVFMTKDESQVAMHGVAYSLAVELTRLPLLML